MRYTEEEVKKLRGETEFLKAIVKGHKTLIFDERDAIGYELKRIFEIFAVCAQHSLLEISFDQSSVSGDVSVFVNGMLLSEFTPVVGKNSKEFDCELVSGENIVEIRYDEYFDISNFKIKISGFIDTKDYGTRLCAMNFSNAYLSCLYNGAKKTYYIDYHDSFYDHELYNVTDDICCASKLGANTFVLIYGDGSEMFSVILDTNGVMQSSVVSFSANASAFFAGQSSEGALFYANERGKIVKYFFDASLILTVTDTGYTGREVIDSGENGLFVIGFDGKAKLITEDLGNVTVKNLGNILCPHVYVSGGRTYVCYSKEGVIHRLDLDSGVRKKLCYGDEYVPVGNGKFLLRTGQKYVRTEEIQ